MGKKINQLVAGGAALGILLTGSAEKAQAAKAQAAMIPTEGAVLQHSGEVMRFLGEEITSEIMKNEAVLAVIANCRAVLDSLGLGDELKEVNTEEDLTTFEDHIEDESGLSEGDIDIAFEAMGRAIEQIVKARVEVKKKKRAELTQTDQKLANKEIELTHGIEKDEKYTSETKKQEKKLDKEGKKLKDEVDALINDLLVSAN